MGSQKKHIKTMGETLTGVCGVRQLKRVHALLSFWDAVTLTPQASAGSSWCEQLIWKPTFQLLRDIPEQVT